MKVKPAGLTDTLDMVCVRERKKSKMIPRVWVRKAVGELRVLFGSKWGGG